jgi:predicted nucleic acid-binding protein
MMIVDTCVLSLVFRRRSPLETRVTAELRRLLGSDRAVIIGAVRQEVLSGVREYSQFLRVRELLRNYADTSLDQSCHERAAEFDYVCRRAGFATSSTDMLICAAAESLDVGVFTTDEDFERYASVLPITLHPVP